MPRRAISDQERKAIRKWYKDQEEQGSKPRQTEVIDWFESQYGHKLSQSTISETLGNRYLHLDNTATVGSSSFRQRNAHWPILEDILYDWYRQAEQLDATGDDIIE